MYNHFGEQYGTSLKKTKNTEWPAIPLLGIYHEKHNLKRYMHPRSSIQSAKTIPRADCGSDHELHIAKFRLKLKKVGKTTGPFRYDLNQIPETSTAL